MRTLFLLPAQLLPISRHIAPRIHNSTHFPPSPTPHLQQPTRIFSAKMASESTSSQLTHNITLPAQLDQPLTVVAAAGVSDSDFRYSIHLIL